MKLRNDERWKQFWLERTCCEEFVDYILVDRIEWCEGWQICDDEGRWIVYDILYCPYCGAELNKAPYHKE